MTANTSIRVRSTRSRKPLLMKANEQYCLDFGQKNLEPIRCKICGMIYSVGEESDEKQHTKYHAEFDEGVRWPARLERPKKYLDDGSRIVAITSSDQKPVLDIINRVLRMSDGEMSAGDDVTKLLNQSKTLFLIFINPSNRIVGYICAEPIKEAHNLVDFEASRLEGDPVKAECGVLYLWVHPSHRRQGIATWLTDIARANILKDKLIHRHRVAVCDPTEIAVPFFRAYVQERRPVKVYQKF